jgi:hypothetical protein
MLQTPTAEFEGLSDRDACEICFKIGFLDTTPISVSIPELCRRCTETAEHHAVTNNRRDRRGRIEQDWKPDGSMPGSSSTKFNGLSALQKHRRPLWFHGQEQGHLPVKASSGGARMQAHRNRSI